jgi:hypothetical protein
VAAAPTALSEPPQAVSAAQAPTVPAIAIARRSGAGEAVVTKLPLNLDRDAVTARDRIARPARMLPRKSDGLSRVEGDATSPSRRLVGLRPACTRRHSGIVAPPAVIVN